jgi:hypothetical protein
MSQQVRYTGRNKRAEGILPSFPTVKDIENKAYPV